MQELDERVERFVGHVCIYEENETSRSQLAGSANLLGASYIAAFGFVSTSSPTISSRLRNSRQSYANESSFGSRTRCALARMPVVALPDWHCYHCWASAGNLAVFVFFGIFSLDCHWRFCGQRVLVPQPKRKEYFLEKSELCRISS